jgi:hypothetical protein
MFLEEIPYLMVFESQTHSSVIGGIVKLMSYKEEKDFQGYRGNYVIFFSVR